MRLSVLAVTLMVPALAVELKPETSQAFDHYVEVADKFPVPAPDARKAARRGETIVTEERVPFIPIPDGLAHDWLGLLFIPGATLDSVRAVMQDYANYKRIYAPDVTDSKLLARDGDRFRVYLKLYKKEFLTLVYDSEYDVQYYDHAPEGASMTVASRSTRIRQEGDDHGFLWRLNSYWRFEQADGGVYAQCRAISLSRGIPFGFGWLHGFLQKFPRDSMVSTLEATRRAAVTASRGSATRN